jgi:hypothetical protein
METANKPLYYAIDQNGKQLFVGDTVLRKEKADHQSNVGDPPNLKFYVIVSIEPDYVLVGGHRYERRVLPDGGECSYITVNDISGCWYAGNFVFSCRRGG